MKAFFEILGAQAEVILILVANFIIIFLILKRFLFTRVLEHLDNRRKEIEGSFNKIDKDKQEIARLLEDYHIKISQIEKEGYQKIQNAIKEGLSAKAQIISESHLQADNIIRKAKEEIELEKKKAMKELRQDIVAISISAAEKVIRKEIDEKTHSKLVEEFLEQVVKG
jgi:F-type H+-transporting ATPase subunit b